MNINTVASGVNSPPGNVVPPPGWRAEWSTEQARYYYVNLNTKESTWILPVSPPPHQFIPPTVQRRPIPGQGVQSQAASTPASVFNGGYPTPPPQMSTGYFPRGLNSQQQQQQHPHYQPPHQQHSQGFQQQPPTTPQVPLQQPQLQYPQFPQSFPHNIPLTPATQPGNPAAAPGFQQGNQHNYSPPTVIPNSSHSSPTPVYPQGTQPQQVSSPPFTADTQIFQQPNTYRGPSYTGQHNQPPLNEHSNGSFSPPSQSNRGYYPQYSSNTAQSTPQQHRFQGNPNQPQPQQQHQNPQYLPQAHQQPQHQVPPTQSQAPPNRRTSMMGSSLMGGSMMNKMSSKFTQLQKGIGSTSSSSISSSSTATSSAKPATDWKKWAKRGAIGVAGIGAVALGMDAAGDMFSGASGMEGLAGGGGGGGDVSGMMDAQTAVDANAAQLAMEAQGQENAMMLLDPVGTEYVTVNGGAPSSGAGAGFGLI